MNFAKTLTKKLLFKENISIYKMITIHIDTNTSIKILEGLQLLISKLIEDKTTPISSNITNENITDEIEEDRERQIPFTLKSIGRPKKNSNIVFC